MAKLDDLENKVITLEKRLIVLEIERRYWELSEMEKLLEEFNLEEE